MEWWNAFVAWLFSDDVARVFNAAVFPTLAILVAGIVGALIGRGSTKRIVSLYERDQRMAAVLGVVDSARRAARWNLLSTADQHHADTLALEADLRLRLLPSHGASMAADWATHEIAQMKRNAVSFSFQAEQSLIELRNRMLEWHERPGRAKKLFKNDLDSWAYEATLQEESLVAQQQAWAAEQANGARVDAVQDAAVDEAPVVEAPVAESAVTDDAPPPPVAAEPVVLVEPATPEPAAVTPAAASPTAAEPVVAPPTTPDAEPALDRPLPASAVRQRLEPPLDSPA